MSDDERWLRARGAPGAPWMKLAVGLGWLATLVVAGQAWVLARVVTAVAFEEQPPLVQMPWLAALLALIALRWLLERQAALAAARAAVAVKSAVRADLLEQVRRLGPAWLAGRTSGGLAAEIADGVEALGGYFAHYRPATLLAALTPLTLVLLIAPRDWLSALILLATAPLIPFFMILIGKGAERRNQRQWRRLARMGGHFLDLVRGLPTLVLLGAAEAQAERVSAMAEGYRRSTLAVLRVAFLSSFTLEFFATVSIAVVAVVTGFRLLWGELAFEPGFFALLLAPEFFLPLRRLGTTYHERMDALGAAGRLRAIGEAQAPGPAARGRPFMPRHDRGLTLSLEAVSLTWPDGRTGLAGLDLTIAAGERVAVVGPSGAGKSTLLQLLLGFVRPDAGTIQADGQPLDRLDPADWRRHLAWVPQRPHLFTGTLADNLRLAHPEAGEDELYQALERAHCMEFVKRLPQGLETPVGDGGHPLSGGQRQRLALARAFLRPARLVLLDEPTAHLDLESEARIQAAVDELAERATLIVVAHRLASVRRAERILVLDQGRLVEEGSHQALLEQGGFYAQLVGGRAA